MVEPREDAIDDGRDVVDPDDPMEGRRFQPTGGQVPGGDPPAPDRTDELDEGDADEDRPATH